MQRVLQVGVGGVDEAVAGLGALKFVFVASGVDGLMIWTQAWLTASLEFCI